MLKKDKKIKELKFYKHEKLKKKEFNLELASDQKEFKWNDLLTSLDMLIKLFISLEI